MSKKRIDTTPRDTTSEQSLGDILRNAGVHIPEEHSTPKKQSPRTPEPKATVQKEPLHLRIEKKGRGGKVVTIVSGFTGNTGAIEDLAAKLKSQCGTGGSVKDREIVMQGDLRTKLDGLLKGHGYRMR